MRMVVLDLVERFEYDLMTSVIDGPLDVRTALLLLVIYVGLEYLMVLVQSQQDATLISIHLSPASACSKHYPTLPRGSESLV